MGRPTPCDCKCGGGVGAEFLRQCLVAGKLGTVIGSESLFWVDPGFRSEMTLNITKTWAVDETALLEGISFDTFCPTSNGDSFVCAMSGSTQGYEPYTLPTTLPLSVCQSGMRPASHPSSHYADAKPTHIFFPIFRTASTPNMVNRVRYFRVKHDGVYVTGILDACDESDWSQAIFQGVVGSINGTDTTIQCMTWEFKNSHDYTWNKNAVISMDVWIQLKATAAGSGTSGWKTRKSSATFMPANVPHGTFGFRVKANAGFTPATDTYELTFNGGTWRPFQSSASDTFKWRVADGATITGGKLSTTPQSSTSDSLALHIGYEVPHLFITLGGSRTVDTRGNLHYVPVNGGEYVENWTYIRSGLPWYGFNPKPGGLFYNTGTTTYVPKYPAGLESNVSTPPAAPSLPNWPTSITVTRTTQ